MSDTALAARHVVVVTATAGGKGDAVFAVNLVTDLLTRHAASSIAIVLTNALGGDDLPATLTWVCAALQDLVLTGVVAVHSIAGGVVAPVAPTPSRALLDDRPAHVVIQAPLVVFSDVNAACGTLQLTHPPAHGLVTVREFGQAFFASACDRPGCRDVSAGVGSGELGVFHIQCADGGPGSQPLTGLLSQARSRHVVGYFRSAKAVPRFARLVAWLLSRYRVDAIGTTSDSCRRDGNSGAGDEGDEGGEGGEGDCAVRGGIVVGVGGGVGGERGLSESGGFGCARASEVVGDSPSDSGAALPSVDQPAPALHVWWSSEHCDRDRLLRDVVSSLGAFGGATDASGPERMLAFHDLESAALSVADFRHLLHRADAAVVCGDQSFNEVPLPTPHLHTTTLPHVVAMCPLNRETVAPLQ